MKMRTNVKRDNRKTYLPNSSLLGYGTSFSKRGRWFRAMDDSGSGGSISGRIIGNVTPLDGPDSGTRYIEVAVLLGALDCVALRWIDATQIIYCSERLPVEALALIAGDMGTLEKYAFSVA
jgi:hypothetical protein